jgi:hypothetical protein
MKKLIAVISLGLSVVSATFADTIINEKFATDPLQNGWQVFGDTNLFQWDPSNQALDVTWDSTQSNSYFCHPLGATFTQADGFFVQFDLTLSNAVAFNSGAELAVGLMNFSEATSANFSRAYLASPDLCEFDYFPTYIYDGQSYPDSEDATLIDSDTDFYFAYDNLTLQPGVTYHIVLVHQAGAESVSGEIFTNGQLISTLPNVYDGGLGGFQLDTLSVSSYADDGFGDSIFAQGTICNLIFASPLPIGQVQITAAGQVQFASDTNWLYTLQQTCDFQTWTPAAPTIFGNGTNLILQATNLPPDRAFYRVRACLP